MQVVIGEHAYVRGEVREHEIAVSAHATLRAVEIYDIVTIPPKGDVAIAVALVSDDGVGLDVASARPATRRVDSLPQ